VVVAAWYVVLACFPNECMCRVAARVPRQLQHACKACARVWIECFVFPITSAGDDGHGRGYQKTTDQFHTHTIAWISFTHFTRKIKDHRQYVESIGLPSRRR
jgi:hypothetical protein